MNSKLFNKTLNKSYDVHEYYKMWATYRNEISHYIKTIDLDNKTVLVVGAGNCNDIDLKIFKQSHVTLLDIDQEAVEKGVIRQGMSLDSFDIIEMDLLQLSDTFFDDFEKAVNDKRMDDVLKLKEISYGLDAYDIIIILPIYTQFILPQVLPLIVHDEGLISEVMNYIGGKIVSVNQAIRRHLKEAGVICVLSDILEYEISSEAGKYLLAHSDHEIILAQHFESYLNSYGHGLGSYGQLEMLNSYRKLNEKYFVWQFDENRLLLVKGETGKN